MIVLHVFHHSLPFSHTGYDIRSQSILESQNRMGIEAHGFTGPYSLPPVKTADVDGRTYFFSKIPRIGGSIVGPYFIKHRLRGLIDCLKPHVIHAHTPWLTALPALEVAQSKGIPFIYEVRGIWEETDIAEGVISEKSRKYNLWRSRENEVIQRADKVVAISEGLREHILRRNIISSQKIEVIPNGVDTQKFFPVPRDEELARALGMKNELVLGYISSLRKMEGIEFLISAMEQIDEKNCLLIVGDGNEKKALSEQTRKLRLSHRVFLTGRIPHKDIRRYYSLIDIFVVPRIDAKVCRLVTPLKPLEAMAMGKCVLVSRVGGLTEIIKDGETGLTFEPKNPTDLAMKANFLIANSSCRNRLGRAALNSVVRERQWEAVCGKYLNIYEELRLKRNHPGNAG